MRKSLVYISQSILLQWNHVCFPSEIWLHATTKPNVQYIFMYCLSLLYLLCPLYLSPSHSLLQKIQWNCTQAKNIMSLIHLTSAALRNACHSINDPQADLVRFAFNDKQTRQPTINMHEFQRQVRTRSECTERNSMRSNANESIHKCTNHRVDWCHFSLVFSCTRDERSVWARVCVCVDVSIFIISLHKMYLAPDKPEWQTFNALRESHNNCWMVTDSKYSRKIIVQSLWITLGVCVYSEGQELQRCQVYALVMSTNPMDSDGHILWFES